MSVSVDKGLDMVSLHDLDFEYVPGCEFGLPNNNDPCNITAKWKLINGCCGDIILLCDLHKETMVRLWNRLKGTLTHPVNLGGCGNSIPSIRVESL